VFSEGVYHFERRFHLDGDVARNRSMNRLKIAAFIPSC